MANKYEGDGWKFEGDNEAIMEAGFREVNAEKIAKINAQEKMKAKEEERIMKIRELEAEEFKVTSEDQQIDKKKLDNEYHERKLKLENEEKLVGRQFDLQQQKIKQGTAYVQQQLKQSADFCHEGFGVIKQEMQQNYQLQKDAMGRATKLRLSTGLSRKGIQLTREGNQSLMSIESSPSVPGSGSLALTDQSGDNDGTGQFSDVGEIDGAGRVIAKRPDTSSPGGSNIGIYGGGVEEEPDDIDLDNESFFEHQERMEKMKADQENYKLNLGQCTSLEEVTKLNADKNQQELDMYKERAAARMESKRLAMEFKKMELEEKRLLMREKMGASAAPKNSN